MTDNKAQAAGRIMTEPRIIPADEAKRLRENATPGPWAWGEDDNISYTRGDGEPIEQGSSWRYVILGARLDKDGDPIVVYPWEATEWNENPENLDGEDDEFYEPTVLMDGRLAELDAALIAAAPDLAHTVIHQDGEIADLFQEVDDHHYDLLRVMEERNQQAEQIKRLQQALRTASDLDTLMERGYLTTEDMEEK